MGRMGLRLFAVTTVSGQSPGFPVHPRGLFRVRPSNRPDCAQRVRVSHRADGPLAKANTGGPSNVCAW
jgi:hypothetical protein